MTAATSTTNTKRSFFWKRFFSDLTESKKVTIITIVLHLLGSPLIALMLPQLIKAESMPEVKAQKIYDTCETFCYIGAICLGAAIASGIIYALFHFSYLSRKNVVDMNYSLPLTNTQRFFADYLSGLTAYMIPAALAFAIGLLIMGISSAFLNSESFNDIVRAAYRLTPLILIAMIQLYTMAVLSLTFCGSLLESILSVFFTIILIPAIILFTELNVFLYGSFGLDIDSLATNLPFLSSSPIGAGYFITEVMDALKPTTDAVFLSARYHRWIFCNLLFSVLFLAAAWLLYKHRKAEDVSKPYVYKSYYFIVMLTLFYGIMTFSLSPGINVLPGIIVCILLWFVMEVIRRRGFKKFWTAPLVLVTSLTIVFGAVNLIKSTNGFGISNTIPDADDVQSVSFTMFEFDLYKDEQISDRDVIESAVELNKQLIDIHNDIEGHYPDTVNVLTLNEFAQSGYDMCVKYHTKNGRTIVRRYYVPCDMMTDLASKLIRTEQYANGKAYSMKKNFNEETGMYPLSVSAPFSDISGYSLREDDVDNLCNAYKTDTLSATADDLRNSRIVCYLNDSYVLDCYANTLETMAKLNIEIPQFKTPHINDDTEYKISCYPTYTFASASFKQGMFYYYEDYESKEDTIRPVITENVTDINGTSMGYTSRSCLDFTKPETQELISRMTVMSVGETPIAILSADGHRLLLLDRDGNRELLDKCTRPRKPKDKDSSFPETAVP